MNSLAFTAEHQTRLLTARKAYEREVSPHYDETLHTVVASVEAIDSLGKADIGALLFWKRLRADTRWVRNLHQWPELEVRRVTGRAVLLARDSDLEVPAAASAARRVLAALPGFVSGDALASAVLLAAAPERMAVYDRRAEIGLSRLGIELGRGGGRYGRYMAVVEAMRGALAASDRSLTAREIDTALYWLGGRDSRR